MGAVAAVVRCPACNTITAERCYCPEHWDGDARICHRCGYQGLEVTAVPTTEEWSPDPESLE
jgi:hypothetical protein